jgi:hypothetical protein
MGAALELGRGRGSDVVVIGTIVGGSALMMVLIGIWEICFPANLLRVRAWLMRDEPPGGQALAQAFDRALQTGRDTRYLRVRGLGALLLGTGAAILAVLLAH